MAAAGSAWRWREGAVDRSGEHLALTHDEAEQVVAVVGPPIGGVFPVAFVAGSARDEPALASQIRDDVRRELDVYLTEMGGPDPWAYAIYHCGTAANLYSSVHWSLQRGLASTP